MHIQDPMFLCLLILSTLWVRSSTIDYDLFGIYTLQMAYTFSFLLPIFFVLARYDWFTQPESRYDGVVIVGVGTLFLTLIALFIHPIEVLGTLIIPWSIIFVFTPASFWLSELLIVYLGSEKAKQWTLSQSMLWYWKRSKPENTTH